MLFIKRCSEHGLSHSLFDSVPVSMNIAVNGSGQFSTRTFGDFLTKAFLARTVTGFIRATQANVRSIVQSVNAECTMLRRRKPSILNDFALPTGTIVHSIHCAYIAFLAVNY